MSTILIADDEVSVRDDVAAALSRRGHRVLTADNGASAMAQLLDNPVQLLIADLQLPHEDGVDVIQQARALAPDTQFIVISEAGDGSATVGAADCLIKPLLAEDIALRAARVLEISELKQCNRILRCDLQRKVGQFDMIGQSPALETIRETISAAAASRSAVLITGECGTGKELLARAIHALSGMKREPFVQVNCAAIPETLLESELFGYQKGAFNGAVKDSEGLLRSARKGTLFLDEVTILPLSTQAKLLRAMDEKSVMPSGGTHAIPFEARIVASTRQNLAEDSAKGAFLPELLQRLSETNIHAPPLRERREDIPLLVNHLLRRINHVLNRNFSGVEEGAMKALIQAPWKGNVRELQNVLERAVINGVEPLIKESDLASSAAPAINGFNTSQLKDAVRTFEQMHVNRILKHCAGDKRKAAKELGISLSSLYRYLGDAPSSGVHE